MSPTVSRSRTQVRWDRWQATPASHTRLSAQDRAEGYTVCRVLPPCRAAFLDVVQMLGLYGRRVQYNRRPVSPAVRAAWETWRAALVALSTALREEAHE